MNMKINRYFWAIINYKGSANLDMRVVLFFCTWFPTVDLVGGGCFHSWKVPDMALVGGVFC